MKTRRLLNPFFLISIQNARLQILRVAKERGLTEAVASAEVDKATERPFLGIGGGPGVSDARDPPLPAALAHECGPAGARPALLRPRHTGRFSPGPQARGRAHPR